MSFRPIPLALFASFFLHVSTGASLYYWAAGVGKTAPEEEITVSYVNYPQETVTVKEAPVIQTKRVPKHVPKPTPKLRPKPTEARSQVPDTLPSLKVQPAARPKTSAELLADPRKGKIFSSYFMTVKEKIYRTLKENYGAHSPGAGEVSLYFILNANGHLVKVAVAEKESSPDISLQNLAVACLRRTAPFGRFPNDLESDPIAFQVKIYFDETP